MLCKVHLQGLLSDMYVLGAGAVHRIFAAMICGQDHVEAEALRLLTRLWAPACARSGQGPWELPKIGAGMTGAIDVADFQSQMAGFDAGSAGRQAKSLCLVPTGRWKFWSSEGAPFPSCLSSPTI